MCLYSKGQWEGFLLAKVWTALLLCNSKMCIHIVSIWKMVNNFKQLSELRLSVVEKIKLLFLKKWCGQWEELVVTRLLPVYSVFKSLQWFEQSSLEPDHIQCIVNLPQYVLQIALQLPVVLCSPAVQSMCILPCWDALMWLPCNNMKLYTKHDAVDYPVFVAPCNRENEGLYPIL